MKRVLLILLLLVGIGATNEFYAQKGGRKREHRNQHRTSIFKRQRSAGHADKFARGGGRKGFFARLFKKDSPAWVYRPTHPGKTQNREQRFLFSRYRTKGKKYREGILAKQNSDRARRRSRGNSVFHHKKY